MALLWTQKQDIGPAGRYYPAMTFDASRERVLLFGGLVAAGTDTDTADTWLWDGADWTQVSDSGPLARAGANMAFDTARERVVLFGGVDQPGNVLDDTWAWDGTDWTQVADTGPSARAVNGLAYDAARERVVLFGGNDGLGNVLDDTWAWDGTEWTQVADTGPEARSNHAMTFDVAGERVLVFGGTSASAGFADTWAWDGAAWSQVAHFGPAAVFGVSAGCDGHTVLLFGGGIVTSDSIVPVGSTWQWNGQHWTERQNMGPQPRMTAGLAFDSTRNRYVLFGGAGAPPAGSTTPPSSATHGRPSIRPHPRR